MQGMTRRIDISYRTIIFIAAFVLLLWVIFLIKDILLLLFVSFIVMSALNPVVNRLVKWRVPRSLAIFLVLFSVIASIGALIGFGLTPLIAQTSTLLQRLVDATSSIFQVNIIDQPVIQEQLSGLSGNIINFTINLFQDFIRLVSIFIITFYLLLDREKLETRAVMLFGENQEKARKLIEAIEYKLGAWLRGQVILSVMVAVAAYIGLTLLGVEFALPLAIIAGLFEIVPIIGPIIAGIPAVLIALSISPLLAIFVVALYVVIQQLEGNVVVPQVMKRAVGINPLLVIIAITIGGRLLGIVGALLAVPIAVVIQIILPEIIIGGKRPLELKSDRN